MKTITFYSYKGGVGRSLALANIATRLAEFNKKICLIDFDLEAPGLHLKFPTLKKSIQINKGIVDYIYEYSVNGNIPNNIKGFLLECNLGINDVKSFILPAGNTDNSGYWKKLSSINWYHLLFESNTGLAFFLDLKEKIKKEINPDFLLIDSRTGISEMSGITISLLADEVVILAANNKENLDGAKKIIKSISNSENALLGTSPKTHFVLSRIPFTDMPEDKAKEQILIKSIETSFAGIYDDEIILLHSDRELEENEQLKIGRDLDDGITSISNDYLKLFERITKNYLTKDEISKFKNIKDAERLFRIVPHLKTDKEKLELISRAINLNPANIEYLLFRVRLNIMNKYFDKSIEDLFRIISLDKFNVDAHTFLCQVYMDKKNYKEVDYWADKLLTFIEHPSAYFFKALVVNATSKSKKELEYYQMALELSPNNYVIHNNIANYYRLHNKYQDSLEYAYKALELNPRYGLAYMIIALVKREQGNLIEFYYNLEQALINKTPVIIERLLKDKKLQTYYNDDKFMKLLEKYSIVYPNSN